MEVTFVTCRADKWPGPHGITGPLSPRLLVYCRNRRLLIGRRLNRVRVGHTKIASSQNHEFFILSRIEHFGIFENFVFTTCVASRIPKIPVEHIDSICSLESDLSFGSVCLVEFRYIFDVMVKPVFQKSQNAQP